MQLKTDDDGGAHARLARNARFETVKVMLLEKAMNQVQTGASTSTFSTATTAESFSREKVGGPEKARLEA